MITRKTVLKHAVEECIKELYSLAQPHIDWKEFKKECKNYSNRFETWKEYERLLTKKEKEGLSEEELKKFSVFPANWENKSITECIGPRPFEYYYLPNKVQSTIIEGYVDAYKIDSQQELLDTIEILKNYCNDPITDKWVDGYKSYVRPACLKASIVEFLEEHYDLQDSEYNSDSQEILDMFFEFLDMAGKFFNWNSELNFFNTNVYLGASPSSNKQAVIDNWKIYRKTNIEIDDSEYDEYDEE